MKRWTCFCVLIAVSAAILTVSVHASEYTWNQAPGETWQNWGDATNWLVDGAMVTAAPSAEDTVKQPIATTGSIWRWDLSGKSYAVGTLSFSDNLKGLWDSGIYDTYVFRNGSLTVTSKAQFLQRAAVIVSSGATISLNNAEIGVNYTAGDNRCKITVEDCGVLEIHGNNFLPRCAEFDIEKGGSWIYGKDATLQNCNKNFLWLLNNRGRAIFENGLCKFNGTWSAPWKIRQLAGEMVWGGPFNTEHNLYYQIELTGGKVSATGDVSFTYDSSRANYFKFTDGADLDIEVADGKTLDLTPFTYDGAATIRKTGAGTLKLADMPSGLALRGGSVTFAANTRTVMSSLEIGEGQSFTINTKNLTIDELVAVEGTLTLAASGLTVSVFGAGSVAGALTIEKSAFAEGDVLISSPSEVLREAVKNAAKALKMAVVEEGESLKAGGDLYVFDSTKSSSLDDPSGWRGGSVPPTGEDVVVAGAEVKVAVSAAKLPSFNSITVRDGATLQVVGDVELPRLILGRAGTLTVENGATATLTAFSTRFNAETEGTANLPKVSVPRGATLHVSGGTALKNLVLTVEGTLAATTDGDLTLGSATAGEVAYFGLEVNGGTIASKGWINFFSPEASGTVRAIKPVLLKQATLTPGANQSFNFGWRNPTDEPIEFILDGTRLNYAQKHLSGEVCHIAGGAQLNFINGGSLWRNHYDTGSDVASMEVTGKARLIFGAGTTSMFGMSATDGGSVGNGTFKFAPDEDGWTALVVSNATFEIYHPIGNGRAVAEIYGDSTNLLTRQVSCYNQTPSFNGMREVRLHAGATLHFPKTLVAGEMGRVPLSAYFTGEGSLDLAADDAGTWLFTGTKNTAMGRLQATGNNGLSLCEGAVWPGTVVADGRVAFGNAAETEAATSVTVGKLQLDWIFPFRVWRGEDGALVNDRLTVMDEVLVGENAGASFRLDGRGGVTLKAGEELVLGTFPKGTFDRVRVRGFGKNLKVEERATETEEMVEGVVLVDDDIAYTPQNYTFDLKYDRTGRSWWLSADSFKEKVATISYLPTKYSVVTNADMTVTTNVAAAVEHVRPISFKVTYPNPDAESPNVTETAQATDTIFRRRFPQGEGPWTITAEITDIYGVTQVTELTIKKPSNPVTQPAPNGEVLVGYALYNREHVNQMTDIIENGFGNLLVPWETGERLNPDYVTSWHEAYWPFDKRELWVDIISKGGIYAMDMYAPNHSAALDKRIDEVWGDRYIGNNMGEYASFIYQGGSNIGLDLNLAEARDRFINRWMGNAGFGWQSKFVRSFSTCGAALAGYELAGGVDFICNEMWAIGAENIGYTLGEARAAARKWGPEYFCSWNAHEWQTTGIPYRTKQKYDSLLVGYLQEWIAGASAFSLESGANGTSDAYKYTDQYAADDPNKPENNRFYTGYTGYASSNYCATTKKFYDWTKANPRGNGTPETKIALALGNCDGYLGLNRGYSVWSQGQNAATNAALWRYGAPENTQAMMQEFFYPHPAEFLAPYNNRFIGGTPYGQVDVAQIDDDSRLADLTRYKLLVFGGWNTMTPHVKDVLERYVEAGGTLVMSRPELTTRVDRDFKNYTDADLLPLFGELPDAGQPGDYAVYAKGKGTYYLFTARQFPSETAAYKAAYTKLIDRLARAVRQTVRISGADSDPDSPQAIAYGVYEEKIYFLNADTTKARTFVYELNGEKDELTLAPCEIRAMRRPVKGFFLRIR